MTSHWGIDMQRQEASCNKTCSGSRVTIHSDVLQDQRAMEQDRENTLPSILTHTHACLCLGLFIALLNLVEPNSI